MQDHLYIELCRKFNLVKWSGSTYRIPMFGLDFYLQTTRDKIKLIHKGKVIETYPNTEAYAKWVVKTLDGSVLMWEGDQFFIKVISDMIIWKSPNPFSAGVVLVEQGGIGGEVKYIDQQFSALEVANKLFRVYNHLPLINLRYKGKSFIYINPRHFNNDEYLCDL